MLIASVATSADTAAWISAIGQAIGALFTAAAVGVALYIAHRDSRERQQQEFDRSFAQARLVRVGAPGVVPPNEGRAEYGFQVLVENYSERPILDLNIELWMPPAKRMDRPTSAVHSDVWERGRAEFVHLLAGKDEPRLMAWRVRWTDADGRKWCVDKHDTDPYPYTGGAPRAY